MIHFVVIILFMYYNDVHFRDSIYLFMSFLLLPPYTIVRSTVNHKEPGTLNNSFHWSVGTFSFLASWSLEAPTTVLTKQRQYYQYLTTLS